MHQDHIRKILDWVQWRDKEILEIGTGVSSDVGSIIQRGGLYHGINIDKASVDATNKALEIFALDGDVREANATKLEFSDDSFDVVYSFGVIHHIPNAEKAVSEIARVLKSQEVNFLSRSTTRAQLTIGSRFLSSAGFLYGYCEFLG